MRIPNKFNGYSRDGIRLYNDPATAAAIAAAGSTTSMAGAATLMSGAAVAGGASLASGMALGTSLYGGGLGGLTGSGAFGTAAFDAAALGAAPASTAATGLASGFNAPNYLASLQTPAPPVFNPSQMAMNTNVLSSPALNPALNPANTMAQTVNAAPATVTAPTVPTNIASGYTANPYIAQAPVAPPPVAASPAVPAPATAPPVTEVVEAVPYVESNPLVHSARPTDFELVKSNVAEGAAKNNVAETIKAASKMTGNTYDDAKTLFNKPNWENIKGFASEHPYWTGAAGLLAYKALQPEPIKQKEDVQHIRPYTYNRKASPTGGYYTPYSGDSTAERSYFTGGLEALPIQRVADGGLTSLAVGGPIETMSAMNAVGENLGYPQSQYETDIYSNPNVQRPQTMDMIAPSGDVPVDQYTGEQKFAGGGLSDNAGKELSKMMGASGGAGEAGGYKYTYDPVTMQFTQLSDPVYEAEQEEALQQSNPGGLGSIYNYGIQKPKVAPKPFTPIVTGGIGAPVGQSTQQPTQQLTQQPAQKVPQAYMPSEVSAYQTPERQLGLENFYSSMNQQLAGMRGQGMAAGGLSHLGGYSDGGRLLRGPGDGVSDSIPASIGNRQPARLADGEFVVPARIVSEIGNGSTEAGARKLYAMMERVQGARKKSVGKNKVAVNSKADKYLPA
jgi:hypothetical protein